MLNRLGEAAQPTTFISLGDESDDARAKAKAEALAQRAARSVRSMRLAVIGDTKWKAGTKVTLTDFREGENGQYVIKAAQHSITGQGWVTQLELEESGT